DVGADVAQRVPDVQAGAGRVGEHVLHEQLVVRAVPLERASRVGRVEGAEFLPTALPTLLDLGRESRVVAVLRHFFGTAGGRALCLATHRFASFPAPQNAACSRTRTSSVCLPAADGGHEGSPDARRPREAAPAPGAPGEGATGRSRDRPAPRPQTASTTIWVTWSGAKLSSLTSTKLRLPSGSRGPQVMPWLWSTVSSPSAPRSASSRLRTGCTGAWCRPETSRTSVAPRTSAS